MKPRLVKAVLLAALVVAGVWFYRVALRPDPQRLRDWTQRALEDIFGPHVRLGEMTVDLLSGVTIDQLKVQAPGTLVPQLWAERVEVQHDVLAMTTGILRLRKLRIEDARLAMHETETGEIELDFEFHPPEGGGGGEIPTPELEVVRGAIWFRTARNSQWFQPAEQIVLEELTISATREPSGSLRVDGSFLPDKLGLEATGTRIRLGGTADPETGELDLWAQWDPLYLTEPVLRILSQRVRDTIESQRWEIGPHRLTVNVGRNPEVEGRLHVVPRFRGQRRMDVADLPGFETIDATTREQLNELFGKIELEVALSGEGIDIRELTTSLGSGRLAARGKIGEGGDEVSIDITVTGLELDDPALRRALGELGDRIFAEFRLEGGTVDATVHLERKRGEAFTWRADVFLQDVSLAYLGVPDPVKKTPWGTPLMDGFPYAIEHAYGHIYAEPGEILLEAIEGRHGAATLRVRGYREKSRTGGETGFVRWVEGGEPELRLTVEALGAPVDADMMAAVRGSEFADISETYLLGGTIDRVLVEVFKEGAKDHKAVVDVEIDLKDESFTYGPFRVPLTELSGKFMLLRPRVGETGRGKEFHVTAEGAGAGGRITVRADLLESERRGRVHVEGNDLELEGALTDALRSSPLVGEGLRDAWRYLAPKAEVDVIADLPVYDDPGTPRFEVVMRNGTFYLGAEKPESCPCVTAVEGRVVAVGDETRIEGVTGLLDGSPVTASGTIVGGPGGEWNLQVSVQRLRLTDPILETIHDLSAGKGLLPPGFAIRPGGQMDLTVRLERDPGEEAPFRAEVDAKDVDLTVNVGALPVRVQGDLYVAGDEVRLEGLTAEGAGLSIEIPSARVTEEGLVGEARARLLDVETGTEVLSLLPEPVRDTIADLTKDRLLHAVDLRVTAVEGGATTIRGRLGLKVRPGAPAGGAPRGELEFDPLVVSAPDEKGERTLHGTLRFHGLSIDAGVPIDGVDGEMRIPGLRLGEDAEGEATIRIASARVGGLLVERLDAALEWRAGALRVRPVRGGVYGGTIEGEVAVRTDAPESFDGWARIGNVSLDRLFDDLGGSDYKGVAHADLRFRSATGSVSDLTASGRAWVVCGDLGELPILANVPALLAGVIPGARKPKFTHAEAVFTVERETLRAHRIVLRGPLYEMEGCGTIDSSGRVDLTFFPDFLQQLLIPGVKRIPVLSQIADLLPENALYEVRVRGHVSNPETTLVALPYFSSRGKDAPFVPSTPSKPPPREVPRWFR